MSKQSSRSVLRRYGQAVRMLLFVVESSFIAFLVSELHSARRQAEKRAVELQSHQENLRKDEERSRRLVDEVVEGLALSDNGEIFEINKTFTRMFGYTLDELWSMEVTDLVSPEVREMVARRLSEGPSEACEVLALRKGGTSFPARISSRFADYRGRRVRVTSVLDISERKKGEDTLRFFNDASAALSASLDYESTLTSLARLSVPFLADWCAVDVIGENGQVERLAVEHDDPEKVALARELQERYPPDPEARFGVPQVLRTGQPELVPEIPQTLLDESAVDDEHRELIRRLGLRSYMVLPLLARGRTLGAITLVMAESGRRYGEDDLRVAENLARRAAIAVDNALLYDEAQREISEREKAERELRRQRDLYETLLQAQSEVGEGFVIAEGPRISYANEAFCKISGYSERELLELPTFFDLFVPEERAMFLERFGRRMIGEEEASHQEITLLHKDGRRVDLEISVEELREDDVVQFVIIARDITDRKMAEEALKQSEERYRAVIEQAAEGIVLVDADDRRLIEANPEFRRMFGYTAEEIAGLSLYDLVAHDREGVDRNIELTLREGTRAVGERRYRRKDGTLVDVMISGSAVRYGARRVVSIVIRDITERKRAEDELRRSEQSLAAAQRMARMGNFEYEFERDRARWSEELYRIFGWTAEEVAPRYRTFINAAHPEDQAFLRGKVRDALRGEEQGSIQYRIARPNGEVRFVETQYEVHRENGRPTKLVGTVQDVTESRRAERKLREAEVRFRTLVEQIPAITYIQATNDAEDPKGVTYMSPQYETIFGYTPEDEMYDPEHWVNILHPEDRERVLAEDARTDETGEPFKEEYRIFAKDGRLVWIRDEAVLVRDEDGAPLFWQGVQYDITEQKRVEEELEARAEELEKSNAELERFAYIASHDLQEPLRMVSSYTQLLARRYRGKLDEDADEFIEYAVDGATRMQALINDLLTYSRVGTQGRELSPTNLSEVFAAARDNLQVAVEESGATVTSEGLPVVMGDFTQLVQLLQNLIGNAIKFRGEEPPEISVGAERRGRDWVFRVRDNGIGIDPRYAERVFIIFQRLHTREDYPGTGIGLAVCKRIVERHGGRMWIESEPGEGSTFFFTLPATEGDRR